MGVFDLVGNAAEWVSDWVGSSTRPPRAIPRAPRAAAERVLRGGSWASAIPLGLGFARSTAPPRPKALGASAAPEALDAGWVSAMGALRRFKIFAYKAVLSREAGVGARSRTAGTSELDVDEGRKVCGSPKWSPPLRRCPPACAALAGAGLQPRAQRAAEDARLCAPLPPAPPLVSYPPATSALACYTGTTLDGRYRSRRSSAKAAWASSISARHKVIDKRVAIKVLRADFARKTRDHRALPPGSEGRIVDRQPAHRRHHRLRRAARRLDVLRDGVPRRRRASPS